MFAESLTKTIGRKKTLVGSRGASICREVAIVRKAALDPDGVNEEAVTEAHNLDMAPCNGSVE